MRNRARRALLAFVLGVLVGLLCSHPTGAGTAAAATGAPQPAASMPTDVLAYVVQDTYRGEPEYLYEIAERFLGDGERWPELLELNRDRLQADGGRLLDPQVLSAGWILQLPGDAAGAGLQQARLPPDTVDQRLAPVVASTPAATPDRVPTSQPPLVWALIAGAAVMLLVAALLGMLLLRRRSSPRRPRRGRQRHSAGDSRGDRAAVWTIDRALRALVAECERMGVPAPEPYTITVNADHLVLWLTAPRTAAPLPWVSSDDGRRWTGALRELQTVHVWSEVIAPYPYLVALGDTKDALVLLDLSQARGVISVTGDTAAVGTLLQEWEVQLRSNPWARPQVPVVHVGPPDSAAPGTVVVESLATAVEEVAQGRDGVLLIASAMTRRDKDLVSALVRAPDASWIVVVAGDVEHARWRFSISRDGVLDTEFLDTAVSTGLVSR